MLKLFNKLISKKVTEHGRAVISEVKPAVDAVIAKHNTVKPKPKTNVEEVIETHNQSKFIEYNSWAGNKTNRGVLIDTRVSDKNTINILVVTHSNGDRVKPHLRWINDVYCTKISPYSVSHINVVYFDRKNWDLTTNKRC